jgi:hypothetical protein
MKVGRPVAVQKRMQTRYWRLARGLGDRLLGIPLHLSRLAELEQTFRAT